MGEDPIIKVYLCKLKTEITWRTVPEKYMSVNYCSSTIPKRTI